MSTTVHPPDELARRRDADHVDADPEPSPAGPRDDEVPELEGQSQLELPGLGAGGPLDMRAGKGRPTSSEFRMRSIGLPLGGQLDLDAKVWLLVEADVDDVAVRNHRKGRSITARVRQHGATPLSVRVLTTDELAALGVETTS